MPPRNSNKTINKREKNENLENTKWLLADIYGCYNVRSFIEQSNHTQNRKKCVKTIPVFYHEKTYAGHSLNGRTLQNLSWNQKKLNKKRKYE